MGKNEISSDGMVSIWKVPLPRGPLTPRDYLNSCMQHGMKPVCGGDASCSISDRYCTVLTSFKKQCGLPLEAIAAKMGLSDADDPAFSGICNYMSSSPRVNPEGYWNGGCCGGPGWCNPSYEVKGPRWTVCAEPIV